MSWDRRDTVEAACVGSLLLLVALTLFLSGCSLRQRNAVGVTALLPFATCAKLDNDVVGLTAASIGIGVLAGGAGLSSVLTDSTPRIIVGGTGVALAVGSGVLTYLSSTYAQRYARGCTTPSGAP